MPKKCAAVVPLVCAAGVLAACGPADPGWGSQDGPARTETSTPRRAPSSEVTDLPRLVDNAAWVRREGERALVVSPSRLLRESHSVAVFDEAWRRVVVAIPEADTPGMRDQFVCHAQFASTKAAWYLEPARPAVGYWRTVSLGCNPGDVVDVG